MKRLTSNTESCDEEDGGVIDAIFDEMWFLTADPVVCVPMMLLEFPLGENCGSFFKKHNFDEQVQVFDRHLRFFFGLHLAVRRHHRRRTP